MALFGFSDIKFNKNEVRSGPLEKLVSSDFQRSTYRYPIDLGNYDKSHYVVFYIREQVGVGGAIKNALQKDDIPTNANDFGQGRGGVSFSGSGSGNSIQNLTNNLKSYGNEIANQINSGAGISNIFQSFKNAVSGMGSSLDNVLGNGQFNGSSQATKGLIDNSINKIKGESIFSGKTTRLTKDAIALYMPDTVLYQYSQGYADANIGGELAGKVAGGIDAALEQYKEAAKNESKVVALMKGVGSGLASVGAAVGQKGGEAVASALGSKNTGKLALLGATGAVPNPMLEMIYSGPNFRTFQFTFDFYPRSEKEALEVQRIIERLRYHQAPSKPEIETGKIKVGGFLVPPSEFDIKFYYGGRENPNIPPIASNCILKTIDVNYAPEGFQTYEVPGENFPTYGRTGMPVHINVQLQFQETKYLTKDDFNKDLIREETLGG
jgi:hypothetical protein